MNRELIVSLQHFLEQVPELVSMYESKSMHFPEKVKEWCIGCENTLKKHNKPQVAEIASLRGDIISTERGAKDPAIQFEKKLTKSKSVSGVAFLTLKKGQHVLHGILDPLNSRMEEARSMVRQVLALADQSGILFQIKNGNNGMTENPVAIWQILASNKELRSGLNSVLIHTTYPEALYLLAENYASWPVKQNPAESRNKSSN